MIETRKNDIVDDYHGTLVADPYRWLEALDDPEVADWVAAQNRQTQAFLSKIPARAIRKRLIELWNFARYSTPKKAGDRYLVAKNDGLQDQPVVYRQDRVPSGCNGELHEFIDPNAFSPDGTVALTGLHPSKDGAWVVYGRSASGSDWQELRIRSIDTGEDLPEVIQWCKFAGIAWKPDGSGFFYNRHPEPGTVAPADQNSYNRVYFHRLGSDQVEDVLVHEEREHKERRFFPQTSDDGAYVIVTVAIGTDKQNRIYYREMVSDGPFIRLLDEADAHYEFIDNDGSLFYFLTDLNAPRNRVIAIDSANPARENWREIIPESDEPIDTVKAAGQYFVVVSLRDAHHVVRLYTRNGEFEREIELPGIGSLNTADGIEGSAGDDELFFSYVSFLQPETPYRYGLQSGELRALHTPMLDFDAGRYEITQVFVTSKDGTRIPMFLTHRKGLELNGKNPVLLYAYGGFFISVTPGFDVPPLVWLEHGGIYAVANLRGGGEFGEEWHRAGMLKNKQNVFDDFISCGEWLIDNGYTSRKKLAINGRSNGGLLVATCLTQRPDLYGAVVCEVPVIDMLRYHQFTVGHYWTGEYGNAEERSDHFRFMYDYSPLHNVEPGVHYPPTLITSADTDDRVVPGHARKFAATLQEAQGGEAPVLLRIEMKAGHGQGKPISKKIEESADILAFLFESLGVED